MDAFTLLKYWKGATPNPPTPTLDTTVVHLNDDETTDDDDDGDGDGDDGPFFDLEFTVPDEEEEEEAHENHNKDEDDESESESEREFKFTLSPSTNDRSDSDDLFFKGKLVQLEPSSLDLNSSEPNSKPQPQFTASLLKSATKFRVFMLGLKKSKPNVASSDKDSKNAPDSAPPPQNPKQQEPTEPQQRKLFTVKFKVEEVPIVSLFIKDSNSKGGGGASANKASQKPKQQNTEESQSQPQSESQLQPPSASDEKRFTKEVMQKYLKMVKPLYIKVSRKYAEKLRFSGQLKVPPPPQKPAPAKTTTEEKAQTEATDASETGGSNVKSQKQGTLPLPAGLRVVCKHLGKSRSASSVPVPAAALASSKRRDDSLLQQQDGIQGAILHCKRSFNASRECESSPLPRSVSDPLQEISPELSRKSTNDGKDERF